MHHKIYTVYSKVCYVYADISTFHLHHVVNIKNVSSILLASIYSQNAIQVFSSITFVLVMCACVRVRTRGRGENETHT